MMASYVEQTRLRFRRGAKSVNGYLFCETKELRERSEEIPYYLTGALAPGKDLSCETKELQESRRIYAFLR